MKIFFLDAAASAVVADDVAREERMGVVVVGLNALTPSCGAVEAATARKNERAEVVVTILIVK